MRLHHALTVAVLVSIPLLNGCRVAPAQRYSDPAELPDAWRLHAERTDFVETGTYNEAVAFCERLAAASPYVRYMTFGISGEGRPLPLLVVSKQRAFSPERRAALVARGPARPLVLIQNCIHAGECEGKDATFMLVRDMLLAARCPAVLERVDLLVMPIFNADGHERRSPFNRINQNGPREMGWRTNAVNLNLNRDYVKADSVEMQAWLRVWTSWQPDVLIDNHTTDGHDHQYVLFYAATDAADVAEPIRNWVRARLYPNVLPQMASDGHLVLPYSFPQDGDPAKGIQVIPPMGPRLSTGYAAACNRVGILVETHALLPYGPRVQATYDFLRYVLRAVGEHAGELRTAVQAADEQCARVRGGECGGEMPLVFARAEGPRPITFHGVVQAIRQSEISGGQVIDYTKEPLDITTELYDQFKISAAVDPPRAYLVPPQWTDVIRRLELHGIQLRRLTVRTVIEVESYRFEDVKLRNSSYEGRQPAEYKLVPLRETRAYPAGSVLVRLDQPRAKLAVHMLEPAADDSCAAWGCFNAIFEQKEYAEAYVLEPLARQMLADEPGLREEFETRLKSDAEFAKSPQERLRFFYQRSEYRDRLRNVYPVGRLTDAAALEQLPVR